MIVGVGLDVVELERIERIWSRFGQRFAGKILASEEMLRLPPHPVAHLASRFAAKEAAVKALGTGFASGVRLHDVVVASLRNGAPEIRLAGEAQAVASSLGVSRIHLSLTHGRDVACAVVILEK
jgi:holo-[acyl-carrier protein] synthase